MHLPLELLNIRMVMDLVLNIFEMKCYHRGRIKLRSKLFSRLNTIKFTLYQRVRQLKKKVTARQKYRFRIIMLEQYFGFMCVNYLFIILLPGLLPAFSFIVLRSMVLLVGIFIAVINAKRSLLSRIVHVNVG